MKLVVLNNASDGILGSTGQPKSMFNYDLFAAKVAEANSTLPAPTVSVDEINTVGSNLSVVESQASI